MKVRWTVSGILISLAIVVAVFTVALVVNSGNVIKQLVVSELSKLEDSQSQFQISYDKINTLAQPGIDITGLQLSVDSQAVANFSQINVSAGFSDLVRMIFGNSPETVKIAINGVSFHGDDALLESFKSRINPDKTDRKTSKFTLPFAVEISLSSMTADIDMMGVTSSIGSISAFARIDKNGIAIANGLIPFIYAEKEDKTIEIADFRISADNDRIIRVSAKSFRFGDDVYSEGISAIAEVSDLQIKALANIDKGSAYGIEMNGIVVNSTYASDVLNADISVSEGGYSTGKLNPSVRNMTVHASLSEWKNFMLSAESSFALFECNANAEIYADIPDIEDIEKDSTVYVKLKDVSTPVIDFKDEIALYLYNGDRITLSGKVTDGFEIKSTVLLSDKSATFSMTLDKVKTLNFRKGFERFVPFVVSRIGEESQLNGELEFSGKLNEVFPDGQISMNIEANALKATDRGDKFRAVCDAQSHDGVLYVSNLLVSVFNYSSVFTGSVDMSTFSPKGELHVTDDLADKTVATALFSRFADSFDIKVTAERFKGFEIDTVVTFPEGGVFEVNSTIKTKYANYPVNISIDSSSKDLIINVSDLNNKLSFVFGNNGLVDFNSSFNGFELMLDLETKILVSGIGKGSFSLHRKTVDFVIEDMFLALSDSITVSCDFVFNNRRLGVSNLNLFIKDENSSVYGYLDLSYDELTNLGKIDIAQIRRLNFSSIKALSTDNFMAKAELFTGNGDFCNILYNQHTLFADLSSNMFEIPLKVKILGSRDEGYFADINYKTVSFEASYKDKKASLYKVSGNVGGFELNDMNIIMDAVKRTLSGGVSFTYTMHHRSGDVQNSADIEVNSHLESLGDLFKGTVFKNAVYNFDIKVKNAVIGNSFAIPDSEIKLSYKNEVYDVAGNMIHGFYRSSDSYLDLYVNPELSFGFEAKGYVGQIVDLSVSNVYFPINMINPMLDLAEVSLREGDITGNVLLYGPRRDLMFYGMLYCSSFEIDSFYLPDEIITMKNIAIALNEHTITVPLCPFVGYSVVNQNRFDGKAKAEAVFQGSKFESFEIKIQIGDRPVDVWIPTRLNETMSLNLRGNCSDGWISFSNDTSGKLSIKGDAEVSDLYGSFELPEMPAWFYIKQKQPLLDFVIRTGKNVEIAYPTLNDPFVSLTAKEGEQIRLKLDAYNNFSSEGSLAVKTGRVYYFNSDFYVTDGQIFFEDNPFLGNGFQIYIDVSAKTRQYDVKGEPLDIYLDINKASLDNLTMRFSSSTGLSENEIIAVLGQAMIPTGDRMNLNSVASFAYAATEAVQMLNLFDTDVRYSLSATLRDSLGLDFLSAKTPLLSNILLDAIPGDERDLSLIAKYLNGTSFFAGKYFTPNVFGRITLLLAADSNARKRNGYFISQDLSLDVEMSVEWETPFATWTLSMEPNELSVFSFLDTIGLTVSKVIRY